MSSSLENKPFKLRFHHIDVTHFTLNSLKDEGRIKDNELEYGYDLNFDVPNNIVSCDIHVLYFLQYTNEGKSQKLPLLHIDMIFEFFVDNLNEYLEEKENKFHLNKFVHQTLVMMAFTTTRGVIFEKTTGSMLNKYYFPIVKPSDFDENRLFEINSSPSVSEQHG